eukprot:jgi/Mesen1/4986/ME000248S04279
MRWLQVFMVALGGIAIALFCSISKEDAKGYVNDVQSWIVTLGPWAVPVFVLVHSLAISVCFPYAIGFEAAAGVLFGLSQGVACVLAAKLLAASITFCVGRAVFRSWPRARELVEQNKYFNVVRRGVSRDGWKFVLLARFSPMPSYIINYSLAATDVRFFRDYLLPTLAGGMPMILQNTSLGTFAIAATAGADGGSQAGGTSTWKLVLPGVGVLAGVLVTWRIRQYVKSNEALDLLDDAAAAGEAKAAAPGTANGDTDRNASANAPAVASAKADASIAAHDRELDEKRGRKPLAGMGQVADDLQSGAERLPLSGRATGGRALRTRRA